jgi:hypothetical protein
MDITTEKIIISLLSAMVGFVLPYAAKLLDNFITSKRIKLCLLAEFRYAQKEIDDKMKWVGRDISKYYNEVDGNKIVDYKMQKLYLGEREEFRVKCVYWEDKYCNIVEILSESEFSEFADMHRLISKFVEKFAQMKCAFETNFGDPKLMAKACFEDLLHINMQLKEKLMMQPIG